jgi:[acyl-carrier-protein] S-malonyltransferase
MIRSVWTFPGQLTEYVGMGGGLLAGSRAFAERLDAASELCGIDMARVCLEGPEELLHRDDCAALAIVAAGTAAAEELRASGYEPGGMIGYSLGLYTAAAAAGAISYESAFRIVLTIAAEGDRRFSPGEMAMGFVTGLRLASLEEALREPLEAGALAVTNVNSQAQIVIAGRTADIDRALDRVRPRAIRCERLPISRPYHSPWMEPIARVVAELAKTIDVSDPRVPLFDHRDGSRLVSAAELRARLSGQLATRLDWAASVERLAREGADVFVEMPPGTTTTRMVRWIARDATAFAIDPSPGPRPDPRAADRARFLAGAAGRGKDGASRSGAGGHGA